MEESSNHEEGEAVAAGEGERPASPLVITLFGPFSIRAGDQPLPCLRARKSQSLLALLVLRNGRQVERSWLAGTLWPDASQSQALFYLRRSLTELRQALGPEARRLAAPTSRTLRLELDGAEVDVLAFDAAAASSDPATLERAVALHRGPLLEGCGEDWIQPERAAREQAYLTALETLGARATAGADHAAALRYLRRAIAADPLRESAQRALMQALCDAGDHAASVLAYREFRLLLHRDLNAAPDPETAALYRRLRAEAHARLVMPQKIHHGAGEPRFGREADSGGGRAPGETRRRTENNLGRIPRPLTRLVGREKELRQIEACLESARLLTLTGSAGSGKTRLAVRGASLV